MKYMLSAEIWLLKTSTRIMKYKSKVVELNSVVLLIYCIFLNFLLIRTVMDGKPGNVSGFF